MSSYRRYIPLICFSFVGVYFLSLLFTLADAISKFGLRLYLLELDFRIFYTAGKMLLSPDRLSLYNWQLQQAWQIFVIPDLGKELLTMPFLYPVPIALVMTVLATMPFGIAYGFWFCLNVVLLVFVTYAYFRLNPVTKTTFYIILTILLTWNPLWHSIVLGQMSVLLFASALGSWMLLQKQKHVLAGLALGCLLIKPYFLLFPLLFLLCTKRWKTVGGVLVAAAGFFLLTVVTIGWQGTAEYFRLLQIASTFTNEHGIRVFQEHNVRSLLFAFLNNQKLTMAIVVLLNIFYVLFFGWRWIRIHPQSENAAREWSIAILLALLLSPHLNYQDLTLLLVPIMLVLTHRQSVLNALWIVIVLYGSVWISIPINALLGIQVSVVGMIVATILLQRKYGQNTSN